MKHDCSRGSGLVDDLCVLTSTSGADVGFEMQTYTSSEGACLNYRIHVPENMDPEKPYPLVLFFHGAGERGNDNNKQLTHGAKVILAYSMNSAMPVMIVAPQCPEGEQWVNSPWGANAHSMSETPSAPMALAIELLQHLQATYPVDTERIYVTGLSMGGFGTWDILQRMPETFAAAMPVCGGGDTERANIIKNVPVWVFHGGADTIVNPTRSRDMVAALKKVGSKVKYTEYEGVGHASWGSAYADEDALKWLFDQKRSDAATDSRIGTDGTGESSHDQND